MKNVSNIEELYSAVSNTANDGETIVLAPGTYALSANAPGGSPRSNGGRLELRPDMSLIGVEGDQSAVKIDTSLLPLASLNVSFGAGLPTRTGAIRMGRGSNSIEWLTVLGNLLSASGIETDLAGTGTAKVRVAHVVSGGSTRGLDVRNLGATMAGRKLDAEIVDNDFSSGIGALGINEAIRLVNFIGADGGQIHARMSGNRFHHSPTGCLAANNRAKAGAIDVRSDGDTFEQNGVGCVIAGAIVSASTTNMASTTFEAHGSKFIDNTRPSDGDRGGIVALGAYAIGLTNVASDNTVLIRLFGCKASGNQPTDFVAFGARSTAGIAGTNNKVTIERHGVSTQIVVDKTDSEPPEPAHTNTVTVIP